MRAPSISTVRGSDALFMTVNCAAIPEGLLESELFGHSKGAFTGAVSAREGRFTAADGGTLFLDEIGDMPAIDSQAKVLRVLQEQAFEPVGSNKTVKVDVRIIAATHKDLREMANAGSFREDLFYRLNVFPMVLPPLRDRVKDLPLLAAHFLQIHAEDMAKNLSLSRRPPKPLWLRIPGQAIFANCRIVSNGPSLSAGAVRSTCRTFRPTSSTRLAAKRASRVFQATWTQKSPTSSAGSSSKRCARQAVSRSRLRRCSWGERAEPLAQGQEARN